MAGSALGRSSILFIAGDVSGDVHAATLAGAVLARDPARTVHALGGKRLHEIVRQSAGGKFLADTAHSSAIGFLYAIRIYFHCRGLRNRLWKFLSNHHVDLAVLVDWGGFNGRIITGLHARGIPVLYYFPPGSWQRTGSRSLGIVPYVTRVATPFRWSAERLNAAGARAEWVGHPFLERLKTGAQRSEIRRELGVGEDEKLVALLPGSRLTEISILAERMAKAAAIVAARTPARFIAAVPRELVEEARKYLPSSIGIVTDRASDVLLAADAAVVKTGTGTLEATLAGTPQVAVYDVTALGRVEWCLLWSWRWIPFVAMPNIILQREVVPELIGLKCNPEKIAQALLRLLEDESVRSAMLRDYAEITQALGADLPVSATQRTAEIVEEMLRDGDRSSGRAPAAA